MTNKENKVWLKLQDYVQARQKFFKEETRSAWKNWKAAELQMVAEYMMYLKESEKK